MSALRKKKCLAVLLALLLCGGLLGAAGESAYQPGLPGAAAPSLAARYQDAFEIGAVLSPEAAASAEAETVLPAQFGFLMGENQFTAASLLDRSGSIKGKDNAHARVRLGQAMQLLELAQTLDLPLYAGVVVSAAQTPRWFFAEDWSARGDAPLVEEETMRLRLEHYLRDVMEAVNARYPGVVRAWTVTEDAGCPPEENLWQQILGAEYRELALSLARSFAAEGQQVLSDIGEADGLILSLALEDFDVPAWEETLTGAAGSGLPLYITLWADKEERASLDQIRAAARYRQAFALLEALKKEGAPIAAVAIADRPEAGSLPLLDAQGLCRPAFFGALQDAAIPETEDSAVLLQAIDALGLTTPEEEASMKIYKSLPDHNPVMVQRFGADPWAMVYGDRVYLYMTGDAPMREADGAIRTNNYSNITTLRVISSDDLVNWQDHGSVNAAGRHGAAKWAANSWAPCAAWKQIDGQDKFFLYFANSGGGIGVLTADSPIGPFTDPLGKALISRNTPTCAEVTWLFDPAVLVDDDGSAYLYFGGGIPAGQEAAPGTARVVKLGEDMISLDGDPVAIDAPWLFEDSGINKIGDTYLYSYCTNFQVPGSGSAQSFRSGEIVYLTSDHPMGPFRYGSRVLQNPGTYFGVGGNNHHCMFTFRDRWYITYHAATVDKAMGWNAGYRSTFVDALQLGGNGLPTLSKGTLAGVPQLQAFDPFRPVPAATLAAVAGAETRLLRPEDAAAGTGDMAVVSTARGGWIALAGVDLADGVHGVSFRYASPAEGQIALLLDSPEAAPAAVVTLPAAPELQAQRFELPPLPGGVHDVYIRFSQPEITLAEWHLFGE